MAEIRQGRPFWHIEPQFSVVFHITCVSHELVEALMDVNI